MTFEEDEAWKISEEAAEELGNGWEPDPHEDAGGFTWVPAVIYGDKNIYACHNSMGRWSVFVGVNDARAGKYIGSGETMQEALDVAWRECKKRLREEKKRFEFIKEAYLD